MSKTLFDKREIMGRWAGKDMVKYPEEDVKKFIREILKIFHRGTLYEGESICKIIEVELGKGLLEEKQA